MRARNIKPGFYKNEFLTECSPWARLLFPGLWMMADREGRLEDRPKKIKGEIFPFDDIDIDSLLNELNKVGMIVRYIIDNDNYIFIPGFPRNQNPHRQEKPSIIPALEKGSERPRSHYPVITGVLPNSSSNYQSSSEPVQKLLDDFGSRPAESLLLNPDSLNPESLNLIPESPLLIPEKARIPPPPQKQTELSFDIPVSVMEVAEVWNAKLVPLGIHPIAGTATARTVAFNDMCLRSNERKRLEFWKKVIDLIAASPFLTTDDRGWFTFDWLIKDEMNLLKILEGKYNRKPNANKNAKQQDEQEPKKEIVCALFSKNDKRLLDTRDVIDVEAIQCN